MIKTKAAVLYEIGLPKPYSVSKPLKIEEVIIDEPGENELIVQVKECIFSFFGSFFRSCNYRKI